MAENRNVSRAAEAPPATLTRRKLLELAGLAVAATGLPAHIATAKPPFDGETSAVTVSPVMEKLSAYMSEAKSRPLPDEVKEKTKHHILDTLAAMISGTQLVPGRAALQFATEYGGKEVATVVA
ncbi:MAG: MmgE/PrpD family protein, partial [Acidobacteriaceae bacterium]